MSTPTTEQEVTGPPTPFGDAGWTPPEGAMWVPVTPAAAPAPATEDDTTSPARSEAPAQSRSHRKHVGAIAAAGGIVGGVALWQAFGAMGLLAAGGAVAGLVAAPVAAYALYKRRGRNRTPMGRRLRGQRRAHRTTSRLGSTGLGKGRGRLGGGRGMPKLGGRGGPKLGGKSGRLLGGKGAKLGGGKSGLGGGRGKGLLGSRGRGGKLLGGGRGSGLGGKSRLGRKGGLGLAGGRSRSRGAGAANRSGGLMGRAGRGGLNLGKRGGRAAHGAIGRWSKSSGTGAGILGRKATAAARRRAAGAAQRAANTRVGQRVAKAVQAAKHAHGQSTAKSPFGRWRAAARAAHSQMPGTRSYSTWAAGVGAGLLALLALLDLRLKKWRAKRNPQPTGSTKATSSTSGPTGPPFDDSDGVTHDSDWYTPGSTTHGGRRFTPPPPPPPPPPTIKVEVIRDEPVPPKALGPAPLAIGPGRTTETGLIRKENMSTGFPLLDAALEFSAVASKYTPASAHDLAPDFDRLPEVIANLAAGFRNYARRIDETEPVEQPIADALYDLFNGINQLVTPAEWIGPLHRNIHSADIARAEAPRGANEGRWNV